MPQLKSHLRIIISPRKKIIKSFGFIIKQEEQGTRIDGYLTTYSHLSLFFFPGEIEEKIANRDPCFCYLILDCITIMI